MPLDPNLDPIFDAAGAIHNVDPRLLKAVASQESGGNPSAVSPAGAQGLMQLMPDTAKGLGVADPNDPAQAIFGGAKYLAQGLDKYGDPAKALMYYHGGPDEMIWGPKTQAYPGLVAARYQGPQQPAGVDALAAAGKGQKTAQAGGSDQDLLDGFVNGTLPFMQPPAKAAAQPTQLSPPQDMPQGAQPSVQGGGGAALDVPGLIDTYNRYRTFPAGVGLASGALQMLQKMAPEGYQLNQDGSLALRKGFAQGAGQLKTAEKLGGDLQQFVPGVGVQNMPGAIGSAADKAGAISEAQQEAQRTTEAQKPIEQRGAGSSVLLPAGSQGAQAFIGAQKAGTPTAPGVTINPDGSVQVGNVNVPPETVDRRFVEFNKDRDTADSARSALFQVDNLRQALHEIGTSGPSTETFGKLSAWAQQMGIPPDTIKRFGLPAGASVEVANKLSLDLLGEVLRKEFASGGGRITNSDISTFKPTVAGPNTLGEASDYMLDQIITPQLKRSVAKFNSLADLPSVDPQLTHYYKASNDWENTHPYTEFRQPTAQRPGQPAPINPLAAPQQGAPVSPAAATHRFDPASGKIVPITPQQAR